MGTLRDFTTRAADSLEGMTDGVKRAYKAFRDQPAAIASEPAATAEPAAAPRAAPAAPGTQVGPLKVDPTMGPAGEGQWASPNATEPRLVGAGSTASAGAVPIEPAAPAGPWDRAKAAMGEQAGMRMNSAAGTATNIGKTIMETGAKTMSGAGALLKRAPLAAQVYSGADAVSRATSPGLTRGERFKEGVVRPGLRYLGGGIGGTLGTVVGAGVGAATGLGVGAVPGAGTGAVVGGLAGYEAGDKAAEWMLGKEKGVGIIDNVLGPDASTPEGQAAAQAAQAKANPDLGTFRDGKRVSGGLPSDQAQSGSIPSSFREAPVQPATPAGPAAPQMYSDQQDGRPESSRSFDGLRALGKDATPEQAASWLRATNAINQQRAASQVQGQADYSQPGYAQGGDELAPLRRLAAMDRGAKPGHAGVGSLAALGAYGALDRMKSNSANLSLRQQQIQATTSLALQTRMMEQANKDREFNRQVEGDKRQVANDARAQANNERDYGNKTAEQTQKEIATENADYAARGVDSSKFESTLGKFDGAGYEAAKKQAGADRDVVFKRSAAAAKLDPNKMDPQQRQQMHQFLNIRQQVLGNRDDGLADYFKNSRVDSDVAQSFAPARVERASRPGESWIVVTQNGNRIPLKALQGGQFQWTGSNKPINGDFAALTQKLIDNFKG